MRTTRLTTAAMLLAAAMGWGPLTNDSRAQDTLTAPLITEPMPIDVDSGLVRNDGDAEAVIFSHTVFIPGAAALRLEFDEALLSGFVSDGSGSYLRIRSLFDGAEQRLDARHVEQWQHTSAYFNGDEVTIEIVAQPGTGANRLAMSVVQAEFEPFVDRSICGPTDDRELSSDNRSARLLPIGCTGWLMDDCNNCFLTAGHCSTSNSSITVVEFNVPLSGSDGVLNHPAPEDQYAFDVASRQSNNGGGVGNDYAYFGVFPNANTGLTPAEAYGDVYHLSAPPPVQGQDIRITGYGTTGDGVPAEWYQVQKTHTGPYYSFGGTTLSYQTDTTGGNSGSAIVDEDTGEAIGIHTHAGCGSESGNNGTGTNHPGLQTYLANPLGVCACPQVDFFFPEGLPETVNPAGGTQILVEVLPNGEVDPQPGTGVFYLDDGSGVIAIPMEQLRDNVYAAIFPPIDCGTVTRFYFSAQTQAGETVFEPRAAPIETFRTEVALEVIEVFSDNFETDTGWTVEDSEVQSGSWDRGIPANGGSRGNPDTDFDGSGRCWLTGTAADEDLDGGPTRLISPSFDISGTPDAIISYARWFTNNDGTDRLTVEISNDNGAAWTLVETVADSVGWTEVSFSPAAYVAPTSTVQVRFNATDNPNNSITEAAVDAFRVFAYVCPADCPADFNGDGKVDTQDVLAFANAWSKRDHSADFNHDGVVNTRDMIAYLNAWVPGC
ncbi:MAG: GC-type dockerin domain-anchored protein [Phycisphaerales bacterium JB054]